MPVLARDLIHCDGAVLRRRGIVLLAVFGCYGVIENQKIIDLKCFPAFKKMRLSPPEVQLTNSAGLSIPDRHSAFLLDSW